MKSENRLPALDVFRGLAIICMLLNHAMHTAPEGVSLWQDILAHGRIMGILQRLGVVYFCGMLIVWWLKKDSFGGFRPACWLDGAYCFACRKSEKSEGSGR